MSRPVVFFLAVCLAGCATGADRLAGRTQLVRDVEGYAMAVCLMQQKSSYLRNQGDAWAAVVVQRTDMGIDALADVARAVKDEIGRVGMAVSRDEASAGKGTPLPIFYCSEMVGRPTVRQAIMHAVHPVPRGSGEKRR